MPARRKTMPESSPMLCTLVDKAFDGAKWTFEPKFDGLRILARYDGEVLTLLSRNNKPQEARFPEIAKALRVADSRRGFYPPLFWFIGLHCGYARERQGIWQRIQK